MNSARKKEPITEKAGDVSLGGGHKWTWIDVWSFTTCKYLQAATRARAGECEPRTMGATGKWTASGKVIPTATHTPLR